MKLTMHSLSIGTFVPILSTLEVLLDKGASLSRVRGGDDNALLTARLAPDMFPLSTQVQLACHHSKDVIARLTGKRPPQLEAQDLTMLELRAHVRKTVTALKRVKPATLTGTEKKMVTMSLQGSLEFHADGLQFLRDWSIPNFYFHVVTAYDILRHNGAQIGKRDFMAHIQPYLADAGARKRRGRSVA